jgi:hypothetical protein
MKRSLWIGRMALHAGIQSRGCNGENPAWLGFSYGSWLPRARLRGGAIKEISGHWLCFHGSVTWWGNTTRGNWGLL